MPSAKVCCTCEGWVEDPSPAICATGFGCPCGCGEWHRLHGDVAMRTGGLSPSAIIGSQLHSQSGPRVKVEKRSTSQSSRCEVGWSTVHAPIDWWTKGHRDPSCTGSHALSSSGLWGSSQPVGVTAPFDRCSPFCQLWTGAYIGCCHISFGPSRPPPLCRPPID
jgi:hypothetical protein